MTPIRTGSFIRRAKDITISSTLALALLAGSIAVPGCTSQQDDEAAYSYDETTYTKGIRSFIKEERPGEFIITSEENVPYDQSEAIVSYYDGRTETLTPSAAKKLIDEEIKTLGDSTRAGETQSTGYHRSGLSSMLLYGGMGYLLGRNRSNSYLNSYRQGNAQAGRYYSDPRTYQRAQSARETMRASRTVTTRPSGGRSGFFGRSPSRSGG